MKLLVVFAAMLLAGSASAEVLDAVPTGSQQTAFNEAVVAYREAFAKAPNEMAAGAQRQKRAKALCAALKNRSVKGWTGFITDLSSNSDGLGILSIETGKGITVTTWNNAISDAGDNTLLKVDSPVMEAAAELAVGQAVEFSGTFVKDSKDCIRESSMTQAGSMESPEFIMRFTSLKSLGDKYQPKGKKRESMLHSLFGSD